MFFLVQLVCHRSAEKLFDGFDEQLWQAGFLPQGGQIIDASLVNVPMNRNRRKENEQIKEGGMLEEWEAQPNKKRQKGLDANSPEAWKEPLRLQESHRVDEKNSGSSIWAESAYRLKKKGDGTQGKNIPEPDSPQRTPKPEADPTGAAVQEFPFQGSGSERLCPPAYAPWRRVLGLGQGQSEG